jgi:hypothetical protein
MAKPERSGHRSACWRFPISNSPKRPASIPPHLKKRPVRYHRAITDFIAWYCSEPRLAFNRTVVLRYRIYLEQKHYAATTINLRLAAVRCVALEAADSSLLSPGLAAGIRRTKSVRRFLTHEEMAERLAITPHTLRGMRHGLLGAHPYTDRANNACTSHQENIRQGKCKVKSLPTGLCIPLVPPRRRREMQYE